MPVALERKLKREANKKGIKDKDAYVYGTLRKTGWKPSREKKMNSQSKLVRLSDINSNLEGIIQFAYDDEDDPRLSWTDTAAKGAALAGAGVGGYLGHKAIQATGGYGANLAAGKSAFQRTLAGKGMQGLTAGPGRSIGQLAGTATTGAQSALGKVSGWLDKLKGLVVKSAPPDPNEMRFDEHILEPFSDGAVPHSKIIQEHFPRGSNPGYAPWAKNLSREEMLKLPFPQLMRLLNPPQQLRQQFSSRIERLVMMSSGLDDIIELREKKDKWEKKTPWWRAKEPDRDTLKKWKRQIDN